MEKKQNKYIYGYKLFVNYGYGYEYETWENTLKEAKTQARCYRENCPQYPVKIGKGRELNPLYINKD